MPVHKDDSEIGAKLAQGLAFLHQARKVRQLDSARVERIARRLHRPATRPRRALLWPALAAVALVMVAGVTLAVAQGGLSALPIVGAWLSPSKAPPAGDRRGERAHALPRRSKLDMSTHQTAQAAQPSQEAPEPVLAAPAVLPEPAPSAPTAQSMTPALAHREQPEKVVLRDARRTPGDGEHTRPAEAPGRDDGAKDAIVSESRAFGGIIESWRRQRDATMALALLEDYERRFPAGNMRLEARVLRAEIYLDQGRDDAALAMLDAMSLLGLPRARELQTVRGELRVKAGRCREARADLGDVLEASPADALAKRATRALAHCP